MIVISHLYPEIVRRFSDFGRIDFVFVESRTERLRKWIHKRKKHYRVKYIAKMIQSRSNIPVYFARGMISAIFINLALFNI